MRKASLAVFIMAAILLVRGIPRDAALAQDASKAPAGLVLIGKDQDGRFQFSICDAEGKLLARSGPEGFASINEAKAVVEKIKEVIPNAKVDVVGQKKRKKKAST